MKLKLNETKIYVVYVSIFSLFLGFILNEDLSTGGSKMDFYHTWPLVINFSNNIFDSSHEFTRHFPFHYIILSLINSIVDNIFVTRLIYLFLSILIPILIYLNLNLLYPRSRDNNLILSFCVLFLPFFRSSTIWPNAHLTALLFLLISNFYYLSFLKKKKHIFIYLNIIFLSLATYSIQSYAVFFIYYLYHYNLILNFIYKFYILILCFFLSLPGFYIFFITPTGGDMEFTMNISYTILTNLSIIFFFLLFFIFNNKTYHLLKKNFFLISNNKKIFILIIFFILILSYNNYIPNIGGGFFYKISYFIFKDELIFFLSSLLSLILLSILFKIDKKIVFIILLTGLTSIAYYTSQKYFEPLLIVAILTFNKNFLVKNLLNKISESLKFYLFILVYFIIATLNAYLSFSKNLIIS